MAAVSGAWRPSGSVSSAESRIPTASPSPAPRRIARSARERSAGAAPASPPQASSRRFERSLRNCVGRYPCDAHSSMPSRPGRARVAGHQLVVRNDLLDLAAS